MTEAIATLPTADRVAAAGRDASAAIMHRARRLWLAGLGIFAVTAEQARAAFEALEHNGEQLEPAVAAPFKRAGEAATRVAERAGVSVKSVGDVVSTATTSVADIGRRLKSTDLAEEVQRLVDEKLSAALERLDVPTKRDLQALADRIEELASKGKRTREPHHGE
jgi:poly(hydroxyalkanoate) granule-associated protein